MTTETIESLKERLKDYDIETVIDVLGIEIEELVERFEDRIDVREMWWISQESFGEIDS